jgi:arginyl-tRNA synthetase
MINSIDQIKNSLFDFLNKQFQIEAQVLNRIDFTLNIDDSKQQFGDISTNAALILAKHVQQAPQQIANDIKTNFKLDDITKIEIAGPGFINLFLTTGTYQKLLQELTSQKSSFFKPENLIPENYLLEYVSANPTGPLHFGHGRGGIIGDALGNILNFLGHHVTREFYINDAGNQMHNLGLTLQARCKQALGIPAELPEEGYKGEYMLEIAQECLAECGPDVINQDVKFFSRYAETKLLARIKQTLADYGIKFDIWFSEKTLHESGAITHAIEKLTAGGYTFVADDALWFKSTQFGDDKDRVLRKSNGELTYAAADIAYMLSKVERGADHLIMILGQDHHSYAVRVEGFRQALGLASTKLDVILYQLVSLSMSGEAVRMSKRAGKFVTLHDIIDEVGKDVARFFFLNRKADSHLDFNLDLALKKTEENPVYYIQYAYVRIKGILRKASEYAELQNINEADAKFVNEPEHQIIKKIVYLKELLQNIARNHQTHQLTYYAQELARMFHAYYSHCKVLDLDQIAQSRMRLLLLKQLEQTIGIVLELLGLEQPEKM